MKLLFPLTLLFASILAAQQPSPEQNGVPAPAAPQFNIPRPAYIPAIPAMNPPLAKPDKWTQAFVEALLDNHRPTRQGRWTELLYQFPGKDFGAALRAFEYMDKNGFRGAFGWEWETMWERWAEVAPVEAIKTADVLNKNGAHSNLHRNILRVWAAVNPAEAKAWFDALPAERRAGVELHQALIAGWAKKDLAAATTYTLENCPKGSPLLDGAIQRLRDEAHRAALLPGVEAWFDTLPKNTEERSAKIVAAGHVAWLMSYSNLEDSMRFLSRLKEPALYQEKMIMETARNLADSHMFKRGIEWAGSLPVNPKKQTFDAVPLLAERWAANESVLFGKWLIENRAHPAVDFVLVGFVRHLAKQDMDGARKWSKEIKGEPARKLIADLMEE